jgi:hypothetical protein
LHTLSSQAQGIIDDLAKRHGFSRDAIFHMLSALRDGNGRMAMFSHPEFGGPGQWMHGGLLMLSVPSNHALKARVDALCHEISDWLADASSPLWASGSSSWAEEGKGSVQAGTPSGQAGLFASGDSGTWWPAELGTPDASGAQDGVRYAYFADAQRLAVQTDSIFQVYDTLDHRITGFSQHQGGASSLTFTSQHGRVDLASLPLVTSDAAPATKAAGESHSRPAAAKSREADILATLERLDTLRQRGVITEEEFAAKKTELLNRL